MQAHEPVQPDSPCFPPLTAEARVTENRSTRGSNSTKEDDDSHPGAASAVGAAHVTALADVDLVVPAVPFKPPQENGSLENSDKNAAAAPPSPALKAEAAGHTSALRGEGTPHHAHQCSTPASDGDVDSLREPFSNPSVGRRPGDEHITMHVVHADSHETLHDGVMREHNKTYVREHEADEHTKVDAADDVVAEGAAGAGAVAPPRVYQCVRRLCLPLSGPLTALIVASRNLVSRARGMTWRQILFISILVALVMIGNFMQILMLNFWLVSFPADGTPGNYTAFAVPGILFSLFFLFWCVGYIIIKRPNMSFAKHRYGWLLLVSIGFCDTFNSWLATYAASYTSEVLQALFTNLSPLYAVFMSKWILKDPRVYFNPWIIAVFVLTITGILAASLYGLVKEGRQMKDGQWWILIFFASIPFRVLQNVIQSLYMIVYTTDESFTFWLRRRLALTNAPTGGKKRKQKSVRKSKSLTDASMSEGVPDEDVDDMGDDALEGVRHASRRDHHHSSRSSTRSGTGTGPDASGEASRTKVPPSISEDDEDDDDDDDDDDVATQLDILDERTLAARLLHDHVEAHMVPMVLRAPPPSMSASFAHNPDMGGAVTSTSIAHSLLPSEPARALLGDASDGHTLHGRPHHTEPHRTTTARSTAPSMTSHVSEAHTTASVHAVGAADNADEVVAVRYHQGEDTIVKLVMLAGETVAQMCFTLALLPADALPWWGNSDSVANTWSNFLEGIICIFTIPKNFLFGFLYTLGFVFTYVGAAYLNHYSVALCSIVTQLSSPLTALLLVLVPSWNVMEGGDSPWFCSLIAIVFLSIAALLYVMWEEKTDDEKIEGERVLKMNKLHVSALEEAFDHAEVSILSTEY